MEAADALEEAEVVVAEEVGEPSNKTAHLLLQHQWFQQMVGYYLRAQLQKAKAA